MAQPHGKAQSNGGEKARALKPPVDVTAFFRDREAWNILEKEVIAPLVRDKLPGEPIRIWVAGCASGEEAYSVAILVYDEMEKQKKSLALQIFASDLDKEAVRAARAAVYPESIAADMGPDRLRRFFTAEGDGNYRIAKHLRKSMVCAPQNLLIDPPFPKLDLLTCRNLIMYFEPELQRRLVELFHFALLEDGHLFLGGSESVMGKDQLFEPVSSEWRIFRRLKAARPPRSPFPAAAPGERKEKIATLNAENVQEISHLEAAKRLLLERNASASVIVNKRFEAQFFHGAFENYFDFPRGEPTLDITQIAMKGLRPKLQSALQKVIRGQEPVSVVAPRLKRNGAFVSIRIMAEAVPAQRSEEELLLVSFTHESSKDKPAEPASPQSATPEARGIQEGGTFRLLEEELQKTRSDLQLTILELQTSNEELETANEELKASNEEITSMNEELQSANEELESSREELQSLNEELGTVNRQLEENLLELESTNNDLGNLLSSTNIATVFLGLDLKIRRFTPSCTEFLSLIDSDIGRAINDLSLRIDDPSLTRDASHVIGKLAPVEAEVQNDRGMWFLRRILPYRTADNKIDGVVVTYTDITSLKVAAQKLESRERQQGAVVALGRTALAESAGQPLFDQAATIVAERLSYEFSEIMAQVPGSGRLLLRAGAGWRQEVIGRATMGSGIESLAGYTLQSGMPVIVEDLTKEERFSLSELNRGHGIVSGAGVIIGSEDKRWGALCALSTKRRAFTADDLTFLQAVANVLSGTIERAQAEEQLRLSRGQLAGILDNADDAIISIDQDQKILMFNHGAEKIFGYIAEEIAGESLEVLLPVRARQAHQAHIRGFGDASVTARRMGERSEIFGRHKNGTEFAAEASISKLKTANGIMFTAILRDITERKQQEALLEARVAERTVALKAEIARREETQEALVRSQKLQGLGQLAGGMAHDFNNLLTVITGSLELLDEQLGDEKCRKLARRAEDAARRGARLIERLLTFGRQRKLRPEVVNLNEIARGMTELLSRTVGEHITLNSSLAPGLWNTRVDVSEIESAILNLVINARDAMPKGGSLIIETQNVPLTQPDAAAGIGVEPQDYVRLSVSDTGSGMPPEVLARAFEPFFTTKEPGKGTGLGLATIYGFAEQSGGRAAIQSEPGKGTAVTLYLPRDNSAKTVAEPKPYQERIAPKAASETVLVVEDNPAVRDLTLARLQALGYKTLAAENGAAAIAVLGGSEKIDLVFSDVVMAGGMSGVDIARWMKENRPGMRVLLTSGYSDISEDEAAADLNVKLLSKPYKQADLARAVREVLEA